jgi:hypothetical protein
VQYISNLKVQNMEGVHTLICLAAILSVLFAKESYITVQCPTYGPPPCHFVIVNTDFSSTNATLEVLADVPHILSFAFEGRAWDSAVDSRAKAFYAFLHIQEYCRGNVLVQLLVWQVSETHK